MSNHQNPKQNSTAERFKFNLKKTDNHIKLLPLL